MSWLTNFVRPRIKSLIGAVKSATPDNLWRKCPACGEMIFHRDLVQALYVCPQCGHHMRIGPAERFAQVFDNGAFEELIPPEVAPDPLRFRDEKRYSDRIREARSKTGRIDALSAARGTLDGLPVMVAVQPFDFMGGSLGMGVGEALVNAMQLAVDESRPFILFVASGGARMQEGVLSLMQMPRVTIAVDMLRDADLPYIVVLTDPTTGGVSASYAQLGDIHIAEPNALIGFAGQRVTANAVREQLPEGYQRAEYLLQHGMIDMVVNRKELRATLSKVLHMLMKKSKPHAVLPLPPRVISSAVARLPAGNGA